MTATHQLVAAIRKALQPARVSQRARRTRPLASQQRARKAFAVACAATAFGLTSILAIAPPAPPTAAELLAAYNGAHGQTLTASENVAVSEVARDSYSANPGIESLVAGGTNFDWAKLVMLAGGWPMTDANVTVMVRWMRQENGANNWWNRNNPLNNGFGSGGGGGTGSYPNLVVAAQMAAENLRRNPSLNPIAASFAASAATEATEHAIWASPWASSHYANGTHWHYTPVQVFKAPAGAW